MSYLNNLHLTFSGDFQADVSTVNNDVRHYDNATFEQRFQNFQNSSNINGWWNPIGSGAFRLINCQVQSVGYQNGSTADDPAIDPIIGLFISGSNDRVGGKIVDLDPQWQLASQLWGLQVRLTQTDGNSPLIGSFEPAAFRDLWFTRLPGGSSDSGGSAIFQSVLTNLVWDQSLLDSPFLKELQAACTDGLLSIRLTTFGYNLRRSNDRFTIGTVSGVIGPYQESEPRSFVLGRRMVPLNGQQTVDNLTFFNCQVDSNSCTVFADLSNALPLTDGRGTIADIGTLQLAMLTSEDSLENNPVRKGADFIALGHPIPYKSANWLKQTGGIWSVQLPPQLLPMLKQNPLALIKLADDGINGIVAIRESEDGWLVRAEKFVHRVEPGETVNTTLFASKYGVPTSAAIAVNLQTPNYGTSGPDPTNTGPNSPQAQFHLINTPPNAVIASQTITTDQSTGKAVLPIDTSAPGNPRQYIDGQIYIFDYQRQGQAARQQQAYDAIYLHLYNQFTVPDQPTWIEHIQPIMQQYSNLYPIMSQQLFDLGDYEAVKQHRAILELAFSLDRNDPNHMPVTRDLSAPKQATILKWLRQKNPDGSYTLAYGESPPSIATTATVRPPVKKPQVAPTSELVDEIGSKTRAAQSFKVNLRNAQK